MHACMRVHINSLPSIRTGVSTFPRISGHLSGCIFANLNVDATWCCLWADCLSLEAESAQSWADNNNHVKLVDKHETKDMEPAEPK